MHIVLYAKTAFVVEREFIKPNAYKYTVIPMFSDSLFQSRCRMLSTFLPACDSFILTIIFKLPGVMPPVG